MLTFVADVNAEGAIEVVAADVLASTYDSPALGRYAQTQGCTAFCRGVAPQVIIARHSGLRVFAVAVAHGVVDTTQQTAQTRPVTPSVTVHTAVARLAAAAAAASK